LTDAFKPQVWLNEFATQSFRNIADRDYIASRMSYRAGLDEPFLWSALQAIEKYLKAIHLYNAKSVQKFGHDIVGLMDSARNIPDIKFELPEDVSDFITYLNDYGANRYLEFPSSVWMNALFELDRSVWHVRRFCQYMKAEVEKHDGTKASLLPMKLLVIHDEEYKEHPYRFKLFAGHLEKVLKENLGSSPYLVWKNFYYGRKKKKVVKNFTNRSSFSNPIHLMHPEAYDALKDYVFFTRETKKYFKQLALQAVDSEGPSK